MLQIDDCRSKEYRTWLTGYYAFVRGLRSSFFLNNKNGGFMRIRTIINKLLMLIGVIIIAFLIAFSVYVNMYNKSEVSLSEYSDVEKNGKDLIFRGNKTKADIIFYPGAKVEKEAYLPLCEKINNYGYTVIILDMPFKLAFFNISGAKEYISSTKDTYLMGHSLGGAMAASFAENRNDIKGIILLGSYSANEFKNKDLKSLSIYGSLDSVLNKSSYQDNYKNLLNPTEYIIDGGNHSNFGSYGLQKGDTKSSISSDEQKQITATKINEFIGG